MSAFQKELFDPCSLACGLSCLGDAWLRSHSSYSLRYSRRERSSVMGPAAVASKRDLRWLGEEGEPELFQDEDGEMEWKETAR